MARDVVFVLGAGASADLGLPTMAKFGEKVRTLAVSEKIPDNVRDDFSRIVEWFDDPKARTNNGFDPENVEETFSLWQMEYEIGKPGAEARLTALINTIAYTYERNYCYWENRRRPIPRVPDTKGYVKLLRALHELYKDKWMNCGNAPFSFVTMNYDLALEDSWNSELRQEEMIPIREKCYQQWYDKWYGSLGIEKIKKIRRIIEQKDKQGISPILPFARYGLLNEPNQLEAQPLILKLHGSINWGACPECGYVEDISRTLLCDTRVLDALGRRKCGMHPETKWPAYTGTQFNYRPLLIPPTFAKTSQSLMIRDLWRQAVQEIQEARCVVFVGYSLPETDMHMKCLLQSALMERAEPPDIIVIDPCADTRARYEKALGVQFGTPKAVFVNLDFDKAICHIKEFLQHTPAG